jgi:hypothetical protein
MRGQYLTKNIVQKNSFALFPHLIFLSYFQVCSDAVDLAFAVPSNSFAQFEDLRDFITKTLDYVVPGIDNVHVGLMIYHKDADVYVKFNQEFDSTKLKKLMKSIAYNDNGPDENRLDVALQAAASDLFTLRSGVRQSKFKTKF